ncbi:MAG: N-acetylmuramoyl-L-alanine amidase [Alphaproteobacteria bacterium]|nr:MAG: N-acetylmuramoyl-L-alanine amidase [Alphaproteobacteria bacterium]
MMSYPSPNYDDRPEGVKIKYLILHYTGMNTGKAALDRLCDEAAKVSAHYLIEEDGRVFSLVPEGKRAWHAGRSSWEGERDINGYSIGIELVNPGHDSPGYKGDYRPFPEAQMAALIDLCRGILTRHDIKPWHVLGHSDVAPARKCDPGELFDWQRLAEAGIGVWPVKADKKQSIAGNAASFQERLSLYGYEFDGHKDFPGQRIVTAFQRHFRPLDISGDIDDECRQILDDLLTIKALT